MAEKLHYKDAALKLSQSFIKIWTMTIVPVQRQELLGLERVPDGRQAA